MRDQRKTEIKVGITAVLAILIFIWVLGWAKNFTLSSERKEISVRFGSISGLEVGDPVTINGVRKGYVDDVKLVNDKVLVLLNLDGDINLKIDAKFYVTMLDLMGGKKIEIFPGNSNETLNVKNIQEGYFQGDIASAMAMLGNVQSDLVDVIKDVRVTLTSVNSILTNDNFNKNLETSLNNLATLTQNLNSLIADNKQEINKLIKSGNELTTNVNDFISSNKDSISSTISSIQSVLKESKSLLVKVNDLIDKTNNNENNVGKLLNDPNLVGDLKTTIDNVKELTRLLVDQLKAKGIEVNAHIF